MHYLVLELEQSLLGKNAEEMYVILELYYNGNHYKIQRGYNSKNYLKIWCEEQELDSASLRNKEQKTRRDLPMDTLA